MTWAHAQQVLSVGSNKVEIVTNPDPRAECATKLRLVEGEIEYKIAKTGKIVRLRNRYESNVACITRAGDVRYSTSTRSILTFSADASASEFPGSGFEATSEGIGTPSQFSGDVSGAALIAPNAALSGLFIFVPAFGLIGPLFLSSGAGQPSPISP